MLTLPVMEKVLAKSRKKAADSMRVWTYQVVRTLILSVFFYVFSILSARNRFASSPGIGFAK